MNPDRDRRVVRGEDEGLLASGLELVSRVLGKDAEKELRFRALDPAYDPRDMFLVVSGGTSGNLSALMTARETAKTRRGGRPAGRR